MKTFAFQMENMRSEAGHANPGNTSNENTTTENRKRKVFESLKVVGILIVLLFLFTGPFVIFMFISVFNFHLSYRSILLLGGLSSINSALNPFVYGWRIGPFRQKFAEIFRKCCCKTSTAQ
jgi:predicted MFS family arabinose efflux permease